MKKKSKNLEVRREEGIENLEGRSEKTEPDSSFSIQNSKFKIPRLRFPEFRGAEGWTSEPMGEVYSFKGNNSLSRDKLNYVAGSVKNIHYGDIHTKFSTHFDITKELVPFINESEEGVVRDENLCAEGDMIFADASEDMADIGKCIEITSLNGERVVSGLHTILARRIGDRIALGFGGNLFKSGWVRTQIQKEAQGAKVLGISANRMRNLRLPLPYAEAEQQKIAECLSSVDALIGAQARKVDALKTHKKGLLQKLFPPAKDSGSENSELRSEKTEPNSSFSIQNSNFSIPSLRFPEFQNAGEWAPRQLAEFITERNEYPEVAVPLFSLTIEDGVTPKTERYERSFLVTKEKDAYKLLLPNDFAFNPMNLRFGAIGRHAGTEQVAVSKYYNIFSCDETVDSRFCEIYFKSDDMVAFYDQMAIGSLIEKRRVHFGAFLQFQIRFPRIEEQQRIAACLSSLDALITAETQKHEALKTHKKGLMQQLFPSPEEIEP